MEYINDSRDEKISKIISFAKTIENDWYALKKGFSISKGLVINSLFMRLAGYFEWVFLMRFF